MPRRKTKREPKKTIITSDKPTVVQMIKEKVDDAIGYTTEWEQNQLKFHKMRMRIKKEKTSPFPGCANLRMPTIEIKMRKVKAALLNVLMGIRPIAQVIPNPGGNWENAKKVEKFLDHLIMDKIRIKSKIIVALDQMLEKGFYLIKPFWNTEIITRVEDMNIEDLSEQEAMILFDVNTTPEQIKQAVVQKFEVDMQDLVRKDNEEEVDKVVAALLGGEDKIKVNFQDVIKNCPDVALCEPERIYVPTDTGYDPQSAEWLIHEFLLPLETVKANGELKGWDLGEIKSIEDSDSYKDKDIDSEKDLREGIEVLEKTGKLTIWEYYGWFDINNDGKMEKCILTIAPDFDKVLRKITLPYYSGKIPFVKFFYELTDDRWFCHRGLPELIEDIVKEIDIQHCQKIDGQTMRNTPMTIHRAGMVNKNVMQFVFGQSIPAHGMQPLDDIIKPLNLNNPNVEFSYEREQMILETKVEELVGQVDFTLQSMINKRQPRTLGEVQMQQQNMQNVFSLDADMARTAFEDVLNWIWELWCQYGDDYYEFAYFGKEGREQPIRLSREEVQGKYKITVRGNDQNTNPQNRLQKAQAIQAGMQNQMAFQMGVLTPMNLANAYKRIYQELDIPDWEELVTMPQPPQPPPPGSNIKVDFKELADGEQAQVLKNQGIQPDIQSRQLKSQAIIGEKEAEAKKARVEALEKVSKMIGGNKPLGGKAPVEK